jgi:hypothetical protein
VRRDIRAMESRITLRLGSMIALAVPIMATLVKLL